MHILHCDLMNFTLVRENNGIIFEMGPRLGTQSDKPDILSAVCPQKHCRGPKHYSYSVSVYSKETAIKKCVGNAKKRMTARRWVVCRNAGWNSEEPSCMRPARGPRHRQQVLGKIFKSSRYAVEDFELLFGTPEL